MMTDVTRILNAIEDGNTQAIDELLPLIYEELRVLTVQRLSHELPGQTLQASVFIRISSKTVLEKGFFGRSR